MGILPRPVNKFIAAGIPDFQSISEKRDLHAGIAGVIAMYRGVDDCLEMGIGQKQYGTKFCKIRRFE